MSALTEAVARRWSGAVRCGLVLALAAGGALAACSGGDPPPEPEETPTVVPTQELQARAQLAGLAAAAQDRRFSATYTFTAPEHAERTVSVVLAADGTWRVDLPGGALGGEADIAIVRGGPGLFQCALRTAEWPDPSCVQIGERDDEVPSKIDPRVQRPFTSVRDVLTDPGAPLAVSTTSTLPGASGSCFSVETTTASVSAPLDVGIYCYDAEGTLTAARLGFGTLVLAGRPGSAPATVRIPGPVRDGEPLGPEAPPRPTPTITPSGTPAA